MAVTRPPLFPLIHLGKENGRSHLKCNCLSLVLFEAIMQSREISHFVLFTGVGLKKIKGGGPVLSAPAFLIVSDFLAPQSEWFLNKADTFS